MREDFNLQCPSRDYYTSDIYANSTVPNHFTKEISDDEIKALVSTRLLNQDLTMNKYAKFIANSFIQDKFQVFITYQKHYTIEFILYREPKSYGKYIELSLSDKLEEKSAKIVKVNVIGVVPYEKIPLKDNVPGYIKYLRQDNPQLHTNILAYDKGYIQGEVCRRARELKKDRGLDAEC